ncbi:alkyl/aryl-sulfatase [Aspergillus melleus]|uniref:alkyl/aryl-sulfatase n=1 Tax=Aspergillus melleus TaxID=138277 RepID=UPI001E8CC283|nr:uncharacterized protein LDX57_000314 [Aspergillus melleus]KAH8422561.1 hypothetical protein LDX57_000314 [Aspergillus melleus]
MSSNTDPSFTDTTDFAATSRGFIAALTPPVIKSASGKTVWDIDAYSFLQDECPETAHPNLWRQGQLTAKHGLYEICPGIYHIRGYDLSNMTIVEGKDGIIIIDPLISCECAAAGLKLYREHRGPRKVRGMVYSHSHGDHYMGAAGVLDLDEGEEPGIPIIALEGFMEAIMSESILAGPAMRKRGAFMYGNALPRSPTGQIGTGLGLGSSVGTTSLIPPTLLIQKTGEEHVVDGVRIVFQMVPGSEAPIRRSISISLTSKISVRDAKAWSGYLDEAIVLFGRDSDVLFGSHHWPTWGRDELIARLAEQRDLYGYMHDQTVRLMNLGLTGVEIAERMRLPGRIERKWHCRGITGGIYQKYMTWFDGRPEHLWQYPPTEEGQRYVECFNGIDGLCDKAEAFVQKRDYRSAATLLAHAVAADSGSTEPRPKLLLASVYEQLGFGAENATWRNFYLTGAQELRSGKKAGMVAGGRTPLGERLSIDQWFDIMAVQLDGERGADMHFTIDWEITDVKQRWRLIVSNGVLTTRSLNTEIQVQEARENPADYEMVLTKSQLLEVILGQEVKPERKSGREEVLGQLLDLISVQDGSSRGPSQL